MRGYLPDGLFICIPIKASICPPVSETTLTWTGGPLEVEPTTVEPPDLLSGPPGVSDLTACWNHLRVLSQWVRGDAWALDLP